ncbi:MAG TPA: FAD-binding oxidoreductase [Terriglobales bacterium]|jgi:glycolate oxidase FAD binding subunit|nr:FAD-binding oxidoreductase [Terriglobales bacterium]
MSAVVTSASAAAELAAIVGGAHVVDDPAALAHYAIDDAAPAVAAAPGSEEEVAAVMRLAGAYGLVVVPAGGFTRQGIGYPPARADLLLDLTRLTATQHYDPGDLTIGVGAGTRLADLQARLAIHQQFLPVDPGCPQRTTVGGMLAASAQGPLEHGYGGLRDFCIGVRFVTADGKLGKGGGRVVKNVAGYDLMKLLIGSFGTLGVITSASFKLFHLPAATRTYMAEFAGLEEAITFRDRLLRSPLGPMCLEIANPRAAEYLGLDARPWRILVRAAGSDAVLRRYRAELGQATTREVEGEAETKLWRAFSGFEESILARHQNAMVFAVSVPIAGVAAALAAAERAALDYNFLCAVIGRAGVGSLRVAFLPIAVDPPSAMQYANAASEFRGQLPEEQASAVVLRCPQEAKPHFSLWGTSPTDLEAMRMVKAALDPGNLLNRGRFMVG